MPVDADDKDEKERKLSNEYPEDMTVEDEAAQALLSTEDGSNARPKRGRANTFSRFSFEYSRNLIPLPLSSEQDVEGIKKNKALSVVSGIALNCGVIIGSGLFSSPGIIVQDTGSVGSSMLVRLKSS